MFKLIRCIYVMRWDEILIPSITFLPASIDHVNGLSSALGTLLIRVCHYYHFIISISIVSACYYNHYYY